MADQILYDPAAEQSVAGYASDSEPQSRQPSQSQDAMSDANEGKTVDSQPVITPTETSAPSSNVKSSQKTDSASDSSKDEKGGDSTMAEIDFPSSSPVDTTSAANEAAITPSDSSSLAQEQSRNPPAAGGEEEDEEDDYEPSLPGLTFDVRSQIVSNSDEQFQNSKTDIPLHTHSMTPGAFDQYGRPSAQTGQYASAPGQVQDPKLNQVGYPTHDGSNRLPQDIIGMLEDRVREDPLGDVDAWLGLIKEYEIRDRVDETRVTYERLLKQFPTAASQWVSYVRFELHRDHFYQAEKLFERSILSVTDLRLWSAYLDYIRRQNNLTTDSTGTARNTIFQAFQLVLQNIGLDHESGQIWRDYISFLQSGPGVAGGTGWQDQQKTDQVRQAFRRAVAVPTDAVCAIWKEYDNFEVGISRLRGRKFLQEVSAIYMTSRTAQMMLAKLTQPLDRRTPPLLAPAPGFSGYDEYLSQVSLWKKWIEWELEDPLVLREEDAPAFRDRVLYAYKQALMPLRFWPPFWLEAAEFCYSNNMDEQGDKFLDEGITANPHNCLLVFRKADRLEMTLPGGDDVESRLFRGDSVRAPYDKLLDSLYDLIAHHKTKEAAEIERVREHFGVPKEEDGADKGKTEAPENPELTASIASIESFHQGQVKLLSKAISFTWIALMRAMRRIQGHGVDRKQLTGFRGIFLAARKRGRLTSDVYVASALIEHHCFHDLAGTLVLERGLKLFPEDEKLALTYLQHLISKHEIANARAEYEKAVSRFVEKPELLPKALPLFQFMHNFESQFGELSHVVEIERRLTELFPKQNISELFAQRFSEPEFDPTTVAFVLSPNAQTRPLDILDVRIPSSPEPYPSHVQQNGPAMRGGSIQPPGAYPPTGPHGSYHHPHSSVSKRPASELLDDLPHTVARGPGGHGTVNVHPASTYSHQPNGAGEQPDSGTNFPPRKMARNDRGESPLKGAAGRRLVNLRNAAAASTPAAPGITSLGQSISGPGLMGSQASAGAAVAETLGPHITFLLGILPPAERYESDRVGPNGWAAVLDPVKLTALVSRLDLGPVEARVG